LYQLPRSEMWRTYSKNKNIIYKVNTNQNIKPEMNSGFFIFIPIDKSYKFLKI
jgi:hypothetical protein